MLRRRLPITRKGASLLMSSSALRVTVDTDAVKPTAVLRTAAEAGTTVGLTHRMLRDLEAELGGMEPALEWLIGLATMTGRPVFVSLPNGPDASQTVALAPKGWGSERLAGYVGGLKDELESVYGPATMQEMKGRA
jgi:hypothetical protein